MSQVSKNSGLPGRGKQLKWGPISIALSTTQVIHLYQAQRIQAQRKFHTPMLQSTEAPGACTIRNGLNAPCISLVVVICHPALYTNISPQSTNFFRGVCVLEGKTVGAMPCTRPWRATRTGHGR